MMFTARRDDFADTVKEGQPILGMISMSMSGNLAVTEPATVMIWVVGSCATVNDGTGVGMFEGMPEMLA
jgi:hypothetical protein